MNRIHFQSMLVACLSFVLVNCAAPMDEAEMSTQSSSSSSTQHTGNSSFQQTSKTNPISLYNIPEGLAIDCKYLEPNAAQALSDDIILWLGSIQPSGITLHENYYVARLLGYQGAFGQGQHIAWQSQDPARATAHTQAVNTFAAQQIAGFGTRAQHHATRRKAGYRGIFLCGGDICYQNGQCDDLGRAL